MLTQVKTPLYAATVPCVGLPNSYEYIGELANLSGFAKIAVAPSGDIVISDYYYGIYVYKQGKLTASIPVYQPRDVSVSDSGEIFVLREALVVLAFTMHADGTFTERTVIENSPYLGAVNGLAVSSDGRIFVTENTQNYIQVFSSDGAFIQTVGRDMIRSPYDVEVDEINRRIVIADNAVRLVKIFNLDTYEYIGSAGSPYFAFMTGLSVDQEGRIFVADSYAGPVNIIDSCLEFLEWVGDDSSNLPDGNMFGAIDTAVDKSGMLYVSDWDGRVALFRNTSTVKRVVTGRGSTAEDRVEIYDADAVNENSFSAYNNSGSPKVASGDIDGDGVSEIITVPGQANPSIPELRVFSRTGVENVSLRTLPFGPEAINDMGVLAADLDKNGKAEVIIWGGGSAQPLQLKIYIYDDVQKTLVESGIDMLKDLGDTLLRVAAGDINGDNNMDLVTLRGTLPAGSAERSWTWHIFNINYSGGAGQWSLYLQRQFTTKMNKEIDLALSAGDTDGDGKDEMQLASWDKTIPNMPVDVFILGEAGQIENQLPVGNTSPMGSAISSDDMDRDGINEILLTLHDEANNKGIVKVLRSHNGFEMNSIDTEAPKEGMSMAVGEF